MPLRPDASPEEVLWQPAPQTMNPPGEKQRILWLRTRLPRALPANAVVFVPSVLFSFEAYVGDARVYRYGPMQEGEAVRFSGYRGHLIPLPAGAGGRLLSFRIFSPRPDHIGLFAAPYLGSEGEVLRLALREGIDQAIIGLLFLVVGVLSLLVYLRRRREAHALQPLSFGLFTLAMGFALVGDSFARRLFVPAPVVWYYLTNLGLFAFPVGILVFFEQVVGPGYRSVIRRLWQLHLAFAALALLLDVSGVVMMAGLRRIFFGLLMLTTLVMVVGGIMALGKGRREARAFGAGVLVAAVAGLHDILFLGFGLALGRPQYTAWGMLVFVGCMLYILERSFFDNLRRLRAYSAELEAQSGELRTAYARLEEHSTTLEEKVEARTQELSQKNDELAEKNDRLAEALARLKATQEQLVLREKMASLGQLTAGIAHEIKNPLNFVNNFAQLAVELADELREALEARRGDDAGASVPAGSSGEAPAAGPGAETDVETVLADLRESTEKVYFHGRRADEIVRSMMLHARGSDQAPQPTDLHALLDEYVGLAYHGMRTQHPGFVAALERDYAPDVGDVTLVPPEVGRVLLNLLDNAFYAVRERAAEAGDAYRPTVSIRTRRAGASVEIRIEDNGPGIPAALKDRIFEPFFTTKPAGSGTGLGLSLSYDIVTQRHGGTLSVESEADAGAAFVVCLPLLGPPPPEAPDDTEAIQTQR